MTGAGPAASIMENPVADTEKLRDFVDLSCLDVRPWANRYVLESAPDHFRKSLLDLYPGAFKSKKGNWLLPHNAFPLSRDHFNFVPPEDIARTTPSGLELFDYQIVGASRLVSSGPGHLLLDDVGLGKTNQILQALHHLGRDFFPFLVISLKASASVWTLPESDPALHYNYNVVPLQGRTFDFDAVPISGVDGYFINLNVVRETDWITNILDWLEPRTIIIDESHELRNIRIKAHKAARSFTRSKKVRKRFLATATPIVNSLVDMYGQLDLAQPNQWGNFVLFNEKQKSSFGTRYCAGHMGEYGWILEGETNTEELRNRLDNATTRRTQYEVGQHLPKRERLHYIVPRSGLNLKSYKKARDGSYDGALPKSARGGELQRLGRMAVASSISKVPAVIKRVKHYLEAGRKRIVVLSYFQDTTAELVKQSSDCFTNCRVLGPYSAKTTDKRRKRFLSEFSQDLPFPQIFFATLRTVGTALNDLMVSDTLLVSDLFWVVVRFLQAEGRLVRTGQKADRVTIEYILADLEIDRRMFKHLERKAKSMEVPRKSQEGSTLVDFLGGALDSEDTKALMQELGGISDDDLDLL